MRTCTVLTLSTLLFWVGGRNALLAQGKAKGKADPAANPSQATPFSTVVRGHFNNWDRNGDGKLTTEEILEAMANPHIKGDAAAAVAALRSIERYAYFRYDKKMPPFTLEDLKRYEAASPDQRRKKFRARGEDLDYYFKELKRKIDQTKRELFPKDAPKVNAVKQGFLGDCFFINQVGAFVHLHPDKVTR